MAPPPSGLGRGERAPDFVLPLQDGTPTRFYARAGGHAGRPRGLCSSRTENWEVGF